jgi:hypothetical protein
MDNTSVIPSIKEPDTNQNKITPAVATGSNPVQKKSKMAVVRGILIFVVIVINAVTFFPLAILVLFIISETINPNPAGIAVIGFLPLTIYPLIVASWVDVIFLLNYLLSQREKTTKRKILASLGLIIALLLLVVAVMYLMIL